MNRVVREVRRIEVAAYMDDVGAAAGVDHQFFHITKFSNDVGIVGNAIGLHAARNDDLREGVLQRVTGAAE